MKNLFKLELNTNRIYGQDIIRAVAIAFVLIGHGGQLLPEFLKRWNRNIVLDSISVFFVLSGFLIGGMLLKIFSRNELHPKLLLGFWIRRWFRILPAYFLVLLLLAGLHFFFTDHFSFRSIGQYLFFSQSLAWEHPSWFFPEAWSISAQEWFYLCTPLLIFTIMSVLKLPLKTSVLSAAIMVILAITCFRYYRFETVPLANHGEWDVVFRKQVVTRIDSLMFGVIGACLFFYYPEKWIKYKKHALIAGIILLVLGKFILPRLTPITGFYSAVFSFTCMSLAVLLFIPSLNDIKTGKGTVYKAITYLSLISYSIYLLNLSFVQNWIIRKIGWERVIDDPNLVALCQYLLYWMMVIPLSILFYKYVEIPVTRLRDKPQIKRLYERKSVRVKS